MVGLVGLVTLRRRPTLLILEVLFIGLLVRSFHSLSFGFSPTISKILPLKNPTFVGFFVTNGGIGGARTRDLGLKRALLYQLSYNPERVHWGSIWMTRFYREKPLLLHQLAHNMQKGSFVEFFLFFSGFSLCKRNEKAYIGQES